jgi:hypothetical protein
MRGLAPSNLVLDEPTNRLWAGKGGGLMKTIHVETKLPSDQQLSIQYVAKAVLGDAILVLLMLATLIF